MQLIEKFSIFTESKGSSLLSQKPNSGPVLTFHVIMTFNFKIILISSSHLCLGVTSDLFPQGFPTKYALFTM
jgi:hypothetical protein